jgi:simple sugar transport system permease protein
MADPFIVAVLAGAVRSGTAVLYAAAGEVITERSGIINLGLEGIMLVGAVSGIAIASITGSPFIGISAAFVGGGLLGLVHAILSIRFQANQIASGIVLTILGGGLSAFFGIAYVGKQINSFSAVKIPFLGDIPFIGSIFFNHDIMVYGTYILIPLLAFLLYKTKLGLAIRAVGEDPDSASAAGIRVSHVRYFATIFGAALAGMGGAYLSLVYAQGWIENMTAGRGLIAVGLVLFAGWDPLKAMFGAYLFGGAQSLELRLQAIGTDISPYILGMIPYLLIIIVFTIGTIRQRKVNTGSPTALGLPYNPNK